jgi:hypothetical protein
LLYKFQCPPPTIHYCRELATLSSGSTTQAAMRGSNSCPSTVCEKHEKVRMEGLHLGVGLRTSDSGFEEKPEGLDHVKADHL